MIVRLFGIVLAASLALTLGCGDKEESDHDGHVHDGGEETADPLADLSAADQKLAKAQKTCPVSGKDLGSMGTPIQESFEGTTVFFCCEGCRKPFLKDPAKYVAKLKAPAK